MESTPGSISPDGQRAKRFKRIAIVEAVVLLIVGALVAFFVLRDDDAGSATVDPAPSATTTAAPQPAASTVPVSAAAPTTLTTVAPTMTPSSTMVATSPAAPATAKPTAPATTTAPTTTSGPPRLEVTTVSASPAKPACTPTATTSVTITWAATAANSVTIGIDNPGAYQSGLPTSGSLQVPYQGCNNQAPVTYYVIAIAGNGDRITRTIVVSPGT